MTLQNLYAINHKTVSPECVYAVNHKTVSHVESSLPMYLENFSRYQNCCKLK